MATSDAKHLSTGSKPISISDTELIAMDLQQSDVNVCLEQQPSAKLRKTTLQFFRVQKGFFIIPALFGGSKRLKKLSLKKGISKTHDGLCETIYEDNLKSGCLPDEGFPYKHQKDWVENIPKSYCEFGQNTKDQKPWSLPRPKRSLRGLFNSVRRHKRNQNVEYENKIIAMSIQHDNNPDILNAQAISDQSDIQVQCLKGLYKPNVPDFATATCVNVAPVCGNADVIVFDNNLDEQQSLNIETGEMRNTKYPGRFIESSAENRNSCSRLRNTTENCTSDQINLIYGDVESLKSFDSLTGCGDIIADRDDDSITESYVSEKISRSAVKRSTCHVTYQGGGEEMASPFEFDGNCLKRRWGNEVPEQIYFSCNQSQGLLEQSIGLMTIEEQSTFKDIVHTDDGIGSLQILDTIAYGHVFNTQSEHQETALNSNERYYNSITPGSDKGRHVQLNRIMLDQLPRNNCSGDAFLYDSTGADDSLISPPFEKSFKCPSSLSHEFLKVSTDLSRHPVSDEMDRLQREKAKLYQIQEYFLGSKGMHKQLKGQLDEVLQVSTQLNTDENASINEKHVIPLYFNQMGNIAHAQKENSLKLSSVASCEKRPSNLSHVKSDLEASEESCASKEPYQSEIKPIPKPYRSVNDSQVTSDSVEDQTISFSQALFDFTRHSNLFRTSTHCTAGSEISAPFSQNMDALPAIVTFDVVNMHNEGQYDEQIDDYIASPFQVFDENRMLEFNRNCFFSNGRAIASLPCNISLTRTNQSMSSPLALKRKSRSLDTKS